MSPILDQIHQAGFRTQKAFAEHIGWSQEHLSRVINGSKQPPLILVRLLEARTLNPKGGDSDV